MRGKTAVLALTGLLLLAGEASAVSSRLYFRINAGNRSLSTVFPAETTVNPGVTGADLVIYGAGTGSCDYEREDDAYLPKRTYQFMTPEDWQWDNTMSDTNFRYWARLNNGTFTQPKIKVTYLFKDGNTHTEVMGTPCVCNLTPAPQGCPLSLTAGNPVEFNKSIGGNISTASTPGGSEPTLNRGSLEPGTTIMVEIWCADGQGDANFYSTTTWDSYIEVPYAPNNFRVWGEVSPQYVERYAGADVQIKYRLWNDGAGAPTIRKLEITIPGHINNTSNFFDNVYVMSVSQGNSTTAITPASPGGNGAITVDFTANPVTGGFVDVIFTAKAPLAPVQTIKWEGKITTAGGSEYFLSERNIDSLFMAVLDFPWTPAGITVTPANTQNGGGALTISWPVSGSPASYDTLGVTQYVVFRDLGSTPVAQVPPSPYFNSAPTTWKPTTTVVLKSPQPYWNNTGLTNKTEYCYQVAAVSGVGVSATSAVVCGIPFAAPWPPATFTVKPANGMCRLDWTPSSPGSYTLTGYLVFRSSGAWTPVWVASVNGGASNTYDDPGLSNGLLYTYNVVPVDEYWNPGAATGNATGRPPANPPTNLTANYIDGSGVRLGWTPSSGNLFDVNGYNIYRATCTSCGLSVLVPSATSTVDNFTDTTAQRATLYLYAISATTIEPAESNLTSTVRILTPPAAPAWLTVAPRPGASLYLEWDDINPAGTVSGYRIYRATQTGAKWYKAAVTPQTATSWVDNSVSFGRRYYYSVASYTQRGTDYAESPPTSEFWRDVEPSTLPSITLTPWNNQVGLAWGDLRPSQFVETYAIFRATVPAVTATEYLGSTSNTYYDDATVVNEMTYWYWVAGENLGGSGVLTPAGSVMPFNPPGQPLSATAYAGQTYIRLEWTPTDPGTFGLAEYEILRATWPNVATTCPACIIATRPATSSIYTDYNDLISGVIYYYVVIAKDTNGNRGAPSPEAWNAPAIPPCAPAMLTAFSSTGWVDLSWSWVNHQTCMPLGTFPVSGYHLYRATAPLAPLASTTLTYDIYSTSYTDSEGGATLAGVTYYYRVRSWDNQPMPNETDDLLSMSPTVNATIRVPALEPAGLTIQYSPLEHDGKLKLTWVPSAKGTLDVVGYRVYRSTVVGGPETSDYVSGGSALHGRPRGQRHALLLPRRARGGALVRGQLGFRHGHPLPGPARAAEPVPHRGGPANPAFLVGPAQDDVRHNGLPGLPGHLFGNHRALGHRDGPRRNLLLLGHGTNQRNSPLLPPAHPGRVLPPVLFLLGPGHRDALGGPRGAAQPHPHGRPVQHHRGMGPGPHGHLAHRGILPVPVLLAEPGLRRHAARERGRRPPFLRRQCRHLGDRVALPDLRLRLGIHVAPRTVHFHRVVPGHAGGAAHDTGEPDRPGGKRHGLSALEPFDAADLPDFRVQRLPFAHAGQPGDHVGEGGRDIRRDGKRIQ